jgi:tetratricopeptide (TPR) repeat protein
MGRIEEGIALYDDFAQRFGKDLKLAREVGIALYNKGIDYGRNTPPQHDSAINCYSKIVDKFSNDIELQDILARTLVNRGSAYGKLTPHRHDLEINDYEEVIRRCSTDPRPSWRDPLAKAFYNKGFALGQLSPPRYEEQVAAYSEVISHFGMDTNFRELVARALYFKGSTLETLNCLNDAVATYEDYLRRFADAPEPAIQEITAQVRSRLAALK